MYERVLRLFYMWYTDRREPPKNLPWCGGVKQGDGTEPRHFRA